MASCHGHHACISIPKPLLTFGDSSRICNQARPLKDMPAGIRSRVTPADYAETLRHGKACQSRYGAILWDRSGMHRMSRHRRLSESWGELSGPARRGIRCHAECRKPRATSVARGSMSSEQPSVRTAGFRWLSRCGRCQTWPTAPLPRRHCRQHHSRESGWTRRRRSGHCCRAHSCQVRMHWH